jgi:hypothetical protein
MKLFRYPIEKVPLPVSYLPKTEGAYGASRDHGKRKHAGCDLYQNRIGTPVFPITFGVVLAVSSHFLDRMGIFNAGAIEIDHGFCLCRYCEIKPLVRRGEKVGLDKPIGQIMNIHSKSYHPRSNMLHFEMYSKRAHGALTTPITKDNQYGRRKDLIDPTFWLRFLEMLV